MSSILHNAVIKPKNEMAPFMTGFFATVAHWGSWWKASRSLVVWLKRSRMVSSSDGWNTLTKKSSKKDVKVLRTIPELTSVSMYMVYLEGRNYPAGTISFIRLRKAREGGSRKPMLKTLGSIRSL